MCKKAVSGIMLTLLLIGMLSLTFDIQLTKANPRTIIVPDDYPTIQEAINAASSGDTVCVRAGIYYEHIIVNKSISLVGENPANTIVDGNFTGTPFNVTSSGVSISNFTITHGGKWVPVNFGIVIGNVSDCAIIGNVITENCRYAIYVFNSSNITMMRNELTKNYATGIYVESSLNISIIENFISANDYSGIQIYSSLSVSIVNNSIKKNGERGIFLSNSLDTRIIGNSFIDDGLLVSGSHQNLVFNNTVNDRPLVYLEDVSNYTVTNAGQVILIRC